MFRDLPKPFNAAVFQFNSFNLRQSIARTSDPGEVLRFIDRCPDGVVLIERDRRAASVSPLPGRMELSNEDRNGRDVIEFYTRIGQPMLPNPPK